MPRRLASVAFALLLAAFMLALLAAATRQAVAAALPAPATARTYPGSGVCSTTLQACINGSSAGDVITIAPGAYITSVTLNKAVSLVGANVSNTVLSALPNQRVLTVTGAITSSTLISGLTFANGNVLGASCPAGCGGAIQITGSATPLLQNLAISHSVSQQLGGGLYANAGSPLTLINVMIFSNTSTHNSGGGLFAGDALTLTDVTVLSNKAPNGAGGGVRAASTVVMTGGEFHFNDSFTPGGGMRVTGDVRLFGVTFDSNTAGIVFANASLINGGGLRADANANIESSIIERNQIVNNGGGVFVAGSAVFSDVTFARNNAPGKGGGFFAVGDTQLINSAFGLNGAGFGGGGYVQANAAVTDTLFKRNKVITDAAGLYVGLNASLDSPTFTENIAQNGIGGGLVVSGSLQGSNATFDRNQANNGGGAYVTGTTSLVRSTFENNFAHLSLGGGLFALGAATIDQVSFISNTAENISVLLIPAGQAPARPSSGRPGGGGLFANNSVTLTHNLFQSNTATLNGVGGGALVNGASTSHSTGDQFIGNLAGTFGGGLQADGPMLIQGDVFSANIAGNVPALDLAGTTYTVANSLFANNVVTGSVAPLVAGINAEGLATSLIHNTLANSATVAQPAILVKTGPVYVTDTIISGYSIGISGAGAQEDFNLFFGNVTNTVGAASGGHSLVADPLFVNPAGGDFHLSAGSPAINTGVDVGLTTDFDGDPRPIGAGFDIGFDEFVARLFLPLLMR